MPIHVLHKNPVYISDGHYDRESLKDRPLRPLLPENRAIMIKSGEKLSDNLNIILSENHSGAKPLMRDDCLNLIIKPTQLNKLQDNFKQAMKDIAVFKNKELQKETRARALPSPLTLFVIYHRIYDISGDTMPRWDREVSLRTAACLDSGSSPEEVNNVNTWAGRNGYIADTGQACAELFARYKMGNRTNHLLNYSLVYDDRKKEQVDDDINKVCETIWNRIMTNKEFIRLY